MLLLFFKIWNVVLAPQELNCHCHPWILLLTLCKHAMERVCRDLFALENLYSNTELGRPSRHVHASLKDMDEISTCNGCILWIAACLLSAPTTGKDHFSMLKILSYKDENKNEKWKLEQKIINMNNMVCCGPSSELKIICLLILVPFSGKPCRTSKAYAL